MLTNTIESTFKKQVLGEQDIKFNEYLLHTTATQDISTLTQYVIESRSAASENLINLQDAFLMVKYKITLANGNALGAASEVGLTHGGWSLLKNWSLEINGVRCDWVSNTGHVFNILTKAGKSYDYVVDNARDMQYYPAGFSNGVATVGAPNTGATDTNWLAGVSVQSDERWVKLRLRDISGFCNANKILPGCNVVMRCEKEQAYSEILMRSANGDNSDGITKVLEMKLYIPSLKVKERLQNMISTSALAKQAIPIDFHQIGYHRLSGTGASLNLNLFTGSKRPRYLFVAPQLTSQLATQDGVNGGRYRVNTATECYVTVNGIQYPFVKYMSSNEDYIREVEALKDCFGKNRSGDSSSLVSSRNFATYNSIYYFDLSHLDDLFENNSQADVILNLAFTSSEANAQTFHCVVLSDKHYSLQLVGGALQITSH